MSYIHRRAFLLACMFMLLPAWALGQARPGPVSPATVLVVKNSRSADSIAIADYYARKRHIPAQNVCTLSCPVDEECSQKQYAEQIEIPIRAFLAKIRHSIDYIVLTKGIPIRTHEGQSGGLCTDSLLAVMDVSANLSLPLYSNPYYGKCERFSHARYRFYLVTRLDGYTRADCLHLVDHSLAARPRPGPFLLHIGPGHEQGDFKQVNDGMRAAHALLTAKRLHCILSTGDTFACGFQNLMGYFSWGSNDPKYDRRAYDSLGFAPGAIAETAVSTSARTFDNPDAPGQSLIGDLIRQGVTGCKGYVSEPFVDAIAHADILFDRYTSGYTLAESIYMASRALHWKDIVIGDPLCAPYAASHGSAPH